MQKKVLIIDDHEEICEMYESVLRTKGYDVAIALDGLEGSKKIATFHPDVILLDIMMPLMDGFTILDAIKQNSLLDCKIIVISNLENAQDEKRAIDAGADAFLRKSEYTPEQVAEKIEEIFLPL